MCVKGKVKSVVSFDSVFTAEDKGYEKLICSLSLLLICWGSS